jgi:predicted cation transporter
LVIGGLTVILLLVLTLPFMIKKVEENLEPFLFVMGIGRHHLG